ncbi:DNA-3-methyladenine glycosylase family protein [Mucilaginibacter segetis]|uniref:DNA-3-methyladenine glycosylase II n=1 Tax=Mucilaginibacter segetis TaxID=2793071 RepID=A0A934UNX0_9SPHI|nr:DNA-3-methyladenine glycosylase 2 family protein [Mucilaginibacter segetis]MBK0380331.1 DNA-3-methyladenine glycosylase 2 family protein [Mucilaginibacter segetis]
MAHRFTLENYHSICDALALTDSALAGIIQEHGYPPMWSRPNTFESLVHIILEQQVSLASARSALNKLRDKVQEITPARALLLTEAELKACYFSRQKAAYTKYLAAAIISGQIDLAAFEQMENDDIRRQLTSLKGIGNWTVDVYLMFVLQRADIFPIGDLAAVNAFKKVKQTHPAITREDILVLTQSWQPYRTVATMLLWHWYLSVRAVPVKSKYLKIGK